MLRQSFNSGSKQNVDNGEREGYLPDLRSCYVRSQKRKRQDMLSKGSLHSRMVLQIDGACVVYGSK